MENIYMEIIILLMLAYIVDKKIFPQFIIMFLAMIMLLNEVTTNTDIQGNIPTLILFAAVILYSSMQISVSGKDEV